MTGRPLIEVLFPDEPDRRPGLTYLVLMPSAGVEPSAAEVAAGVVRPARSGSFWLQSTALQRK